MSAAPGYAFPAPPSAPGGVLDTLASRVRPVDLARDQQVPVLPVLEPLVPGAALRRGTTVAVAGAPGDEVAASGATALALALVAGASQNGSWVASVGLGGAGLVSAVGYGLATSRFASVPAPEPRLWASVVASLVDGFDVVLVAAWPHVRLRPADARRLVARVRERGSVLVAVGGDLPERSRLQLTVTAAGWEGPDAEGYGHLRRRRVTVASGGRGEAVRSRRAQLWLPSGDGTVAPVEEVAPAVPFTRRSRPPADGVASRGQGTLRHLRSPDVTGTEAAEGPAAEGSRGEVGAGPDGRSSPDGSSRRRSSRGARPAPVPAEAAS